VVNHHIYDEETVCFYAVDGGVSVKRVMYEPSHVLCQLPACAYDVPCAILEDVAQPVTVRFAEFEVRPRNRRLEPKRPIDNVKCGLEVRVSVGAGICQRLLLMIHELYLTCQGFVVTVDAPALEV